MAGLNTMLKRLPVFHYQAALDTEELPKGVHILDGYVRVKGTVTNTGGTTLTLRNDPTPRIVKSISLILDGEDIIARLSGRELYALNRRLVNQAPTDTLLTSVAADATSVDFLFRLPLSWRFLMDPIDVHLPPINPGQSYRVEIEWETSTVNAASSQGSGAFYSAGDRTVTLTDFQAEVTLKIAPRSKMPLYLPRITTLDSDQWTAANNRLPIELRRANDFAAFLLQIKEGSGSDYADLLNTFGLRSGSTTWYDDVQAKVLHEVEQGDFPAVGDAANEQGNYFFNFADGGKLGNHVEPRAMDSPRIELDVDAPGTSPGVARVIFFELWRPPGLVREAV